MRNFLETVACLLSLQYTPNKLDKCGMFPNFELSVTKTTRASVASHMLTLANTIEVPKGKTGGKKEKQSFKTLCFSLEKGSVTADYSGFPLFFHNISHLY